MPKTLDIRLKSKPYKKILCLCCIILSALIFYTVNATRNGLWYDEAVEYFYSKYLTGPVPGGLGTANMFERIRITYQPPLYNVLMFIWLKIFDSEFAFRFAGVLVTVIGSIGVFMAINEILPDGIWSYLGTLFYLFSYGTVYYALECAEYNLMLCCIAWTLYFFYRLQHKRNIRSTVGFMVFSCLSIYSQYGAAFIIGGMALSLLLSFIHDKDYKQLKIYLLSGIISVLFVILPLVVFFLIPQMNNQEGTVLSHKLFFARGLFVDFFAGGYEVAKAMFGQYIVIFVLILLMLCLPSIILKPGKMIFSVISLAFAWITYFFAVCSSFYGNKVWDTDSTGSMNLGGRYSYFFIPAIVIFIFIGLGELAGLIKEKKESIANILAASLALCIILSCTYEICRTSSNSIHKNDDDVRELVSVWYDRELFNSRTLLFQWDDALFNFYLTHDNRYQESFSKSVKATGKWIRTADYNEMREKLADMGCLTVSDFYYVTSNTKDNPNFLSVMKNEGYVEETIFSGESRLIRFTRQNRLQSSTQDT